jgi:histidine triad (HIT) family protein
MSDCDFCGLIAKKVNALFEDDKLFAMLSPEPAAAGHILVLPKAHAPILEAVPDFVVGDMFKAANKLGVAVFEALGAQGTNVLVQNGPSAGQRHNHAMLHVIPRFEDDKLPIGWAPKPASDSDLAGLESKIKDETKNVGLFEKEKPKPMEVEKPKEIAKEDYRVKHLRRVP